ncbi:hypothetical protein O9929_12710 [Vibrio lentus]|nr:hypothetical protein [Vibrio lentus]
MRTIQLNGIPTGDFCDAAADAVVISLKSRSCPVAITDSVTAPSNGFNLAQANSFTKYCSTFDSTAEGNIGPVTDALLAELGESFTMVCPVRHS